MGDYPDHTDVMQIIGSDIMVPIDVQGAYIMMPVDIQAQYVNVEVDIVAQTIGNIAIDIAAQTLEELSINIAASDITLDINIESSDITLNVDITAQTIGNITIDIEAQSVAVYNPADWSVKEDIDINLTGVVTNKATGSDETVINYTVTTSKSLTICHFGGHCSSQSANVAGYLYNYSDSVVLAVSGGAQGFLHPLNKPIKLAAGKVLYLQLIHFGAANGDMVGHIGGYEE